MKVFRALLVVASLTALAQPAWGEDTYRQLLSLTRQTMQQFAGYGYRITGIYVGTGDTRVWYYDSLTPGAEVLPLSALLGYLDQMPNGRQS